MTGERLAQFRSVRLLAFRGIGAQVEGAAIQATAAGWVARRGPDGVVGFERQPVASDAWRQRVLVRALEPLLDRVRLLTLEETEPGMRRLTLRAGTQAGIAALRESREQGLN